MKNPAGRRGHWERSWLIQYSRGVPVSARKNNKEKSIYSLAVKIADLMHSHSNRLEAIDACDIARILFRKTSKITDPSPVVRRLTP